jgi:mannose-1-phosphate guanylyltransferase
MSASDLFAVIMAGGSGKRFWPASRAGLPKQFLPIAGEQPMIAATAARLDGLVPPERILVVCGAAHEGLVRRTLPDLPRENVLVEPLARNTAPCVAWAALEIERRDPRSVQIVLPADHAIEPVDAFKQSLLAAAEEARAEDVLVTLGVKPTHAATGYGYIEAVEEVRTRNGHAVRVVERFVEKPDRWRAQEFFDSHRFFWNGGIFVWRTQAIVSALQRHVPEVHDELRKALASGSVAAVYPTLPAQAVDVAVVEKAAEARGVRMVPIEYRWNDVGAWTALPDVHGKDEQGNTTAGGGALVAQDATGCIVWNEPGTLTALLGVQDVIVVRAGNATLVCARDRAEDLRRIVADLERDHPSFA